MFYGRMSYKPETEISKVYEEIAGMRQFYQGVDKYAIQGQSTPWSTCVIISVFTSVEHRTLRKEGTYYVFAAKDGNPTVLINGAEHPEEYHRLFNSRICDLQ